MLRTPEKGHSESNPHSDPNDSDTTQPPSFVSSRIKRKRSEEILTDLAEFKTEFKSEIKDMITSWMAQQSDERTQITSSLKSIEESLTFLSTKYDDMCKKVELMEQERHKHKEYITILENKIENLMKLQRKCSFELKNVPRSENESKETLVSMVCNLSTSLKVDIHKNDIKDIYRTTMKGDKKPIVVEMSTYFQKLNITTAAKKFNIYNNNNKLNTQNLGLKGTCTPVFISDHLTPNGNRLYYLAREMCKTMNFKYCWTSVGEVLVRKNDTSPIIKLINEAQIKCMYEPIK